jgi:hypothetical protein
MAAGDSNELRDGGRAVWGASEVSRIEDLPPLEENSPALLPSVEELTLNQIPLRSMLVVIIRRQTNARDNLILRRIGPSWGEGNIGQY